MLTVVHKENKEVKECTGRQQYLPWEVYRQSMYVYTLEIEKGTLLYNLFTREIVLVSDESDESDKRRLVEKWFYVPVRIDEYSLVYGFWQRYYSKHPRIKRPLRNVVIFTTTECNACCAYCYEQGSSINRMTPETADKVADYIIDKSGEEVHLKWFGGEPLMNTEVMEIICNRLRGAGKKYDSEIITNGYLFPNVTDSTIRDVWKLKWVQITIDGTKAEYERIKGINGLYKIVIDAIRHLVLLGVSVDIRTHVTKDNGEDLKQLVKDLESEFGCIANNKIQMYAVPIFKDPKNPLTQEEEVRLYDSLIEVCDLIESSKIGRKRRVRGVKGNHCMADSGCGIAISPTGMLTPCEHYHDDEIVGDITSGGRIPAKWFERDPELTECKRCFYYPQCFNLKMCTAEAKCDEQNRRFIRYSTEKIMLNEYNEFISNGRYPIGA